MRNRKTQGFTLIELLIVIAIIGILAAVLIPNLLNARARAQDTAAQACAKEILTQAEIWNIDNPATGYANFEVPEDGEDGAPTACRGLDRDVTDADGTTVSGTVTSASTQVFDFSNTSGIQKHE